jgi:hypothetical protein
MNNDEKKTYYLAPMTPLFTIFNLKIFTRYLQGLFRDFFVRKRFRVLSYVSKLLSSSRYAQIISKHKLEIKDIKKKEKCVQ